MNNVTAVTFGVWLVAGGIYRCLGATAQLRLRAADWDPCASGVDALKLAKVSGLCRERVQVQRSVSPRPPDTLRHRPRSNSPARSLLEKPQPSVATSGSRQPRRTRWKNCSPSIPCPPANRACLAVCTGRGYDWRIRVDFCPAFSLFWTTTPLLLAGPAFRLSQGGIALFALPVATLSYFLTDRFPIP